MIGVEDWGKLYYAIIRTRANKNIEVVGIGSTKLICRNSAIDYRTGVGTHIANTFLPAIERVDINQTAVHSAEGNSYSMVYAEAKVYIYGKRYGYEGMIVTYDPTYREDLIRFAGYKKKSKRRK